MVPSSLVSAVSCHSLWISNRIRLLQLLLSVQGNVDKSILLKAIAIPRSLAINLCNLRSAAYSPQHTFTEAAMAFAMQTSMCRPRVSPAFTARPVSRVTRGRVLTRAVSLFHMLNSSMHDCVLRCVLGRQLIISCSRFRGLVGGSVHACEA